MPAETVDQRILEKYDELSPQQRRLADVVLETGGDLARWTASELAERAGVSKATAARLFQALGYSDFEEARRVARQSLPWGSPLRGLGEAGPPGERDRAQTHFARDMENLRRTEAALDREAMQRAAEWLASSNTIWVVGFRNSFALAQYARSVLHSLKADVRFVPTPAFELAEDLSAMRGGDAMLVIGFRRRPNALVEILNVAAECGVGSVLLTDLSAALTPRLAGITLRCHTRGPGPFDSYAAAMSVLNLLMSQVSEELKTAASQRLSRIEDLHSRLGDLRAPGQNEDKD
ncbi:MurR/RpiR family transcriptional regulator [Ferruginivarius sediminum]|nr:MurR/RpiR family transcriptional regulator [Ferruginivarius sediminum]